MNYLFVVYILIIFWLLRKRFVACPTGSLTNPLFFVVGFGALYFLLPASYIEYILLVSGFPVEDNIIHECWFWSFWYETIFLLFYLKSRDVKLKFNNVRASSQMLKIAQWLNIFLCLLLAFILLVYVPPIFAVHADRGAAFELYEYTINSPFRFRQITYCHMVIMFILVWNKRNLKYLFPSLAYLLIDYSHGGRTSSLIILLFAYFCFILINGKTYLKYAAVCLFFLIIVGLLQRSEATEFYEMLFSAGMEFSNTYLTTAYLIDHPEYHLNGFEYALVSFMKIFPGGVFDKMIGFLWYGDILSDKIGIGYGLAGNLITEALIYGGKWFSLINPFLLGTLLYIFNAMRMKKTLLGILSIMLLCFTMQVSVRQFIWGFILYPFQIVLFYCIWAYPSFNKKIFV